MSDNEVINKSSEGGAKLIPQGDMDFIMTCLQNTISGQISVDAAAVADELGFSNLKSVYNKMAKMRKDYDFPIAPAKAGEKAAATITGDKIDKGEKTDKPEKPVKPATATPRKRAAPKADANGENGSPSPVKRRGPGRPRKDAAAKVVKATEEKSKGEDGKEDAKAGKGKSEETKEDGANDEAEA